MSHPNITWHCGECGYPRNHDTPHTCPPDTQQVVHTLVDALPTNAPNAAVREEIEALSVLLKEHRPDAVQVGADALRWLLSGFSFLDASTDALKAHAAILRRKP